MKQRIAFLFVALCAVFAAALVNAQTVRTHVLTLEIKVGDKAVMTPTVELLPGKLATLKVADPAAGKGGKHVLQVMLSEGQPDNTLAVAMNLFAGDAIPENLLGDPTIFIRAGDTGSATIEGPNGKVQFSIISHAVRELSGTAASAASDAAAKCEAAKSISMAKGEDCCTVPCSPPATVATG